MKSTYTAAVRVSPASRRRGAGGASALHGAVPPQVPDGVTVLMSASQSWFSEQDRVFHFSMDFPVPSYLVALVAGELEHEDVGPR